MNDDLLDFVKGKLEEGEGIAPAALTRVLAAANEPKPAERHSRVLRPIIGYGALSAASLVLACCGWFMRSAESAQREVEVSNVIALLQAMDGSQSVESLPLSDALLSWQDAPCSDSRN